MLTIDNTLEYLRESLSNHMESDMCQQIVKKIETTRYEGEEQFVRDLTEEEMEYLNDVVEKELNYARSVQNDIRAEELKAVYELLF